MKKAYAPHLDVIRESITAIAGYQPTDKEAFLASAVTQDAVLMRLQVIGEHLSRMRRLDEERFAEVADDAWFQRIGLRNVISHGYETIDRERIWQMMTDDLPDLQTSLAIFTDE